ncbi:hypothetical protein [Paracoccus tibetensis]|uniref:Uncharacterized protein n=1 Tax=Paracoccus tibetensis TaxID=336292 RepID=A0A1G5B733_9RHOB|nr:hypothetical protein [Paracoccus tibetensis]SCX85895.1 hypothetical protein SAMN05660710_00021 [Paracoccus tibetensis]
MPLRQSPAARASAARAPLCAITLIDRRTGRPHRVNGAALVALSRDPDGAAAELLAGRDPRIWSARVQPLPGATR